MKKAAIILIFTLTVSPSFAQRTLSVKDLLPGGQAPQAQQAQPTRQAAPSRVQPTRTRRPPVVTREDFETLNNSDRAQVYNELSRYDRFLTTHCSTRPDGTQVLDETCGRIDVRNGDPHFHPELIPPPRATRLFANIPKNSKVSVLTKCEEDGKFYTTITYTDSNGHHRAFKNPYDNSTKCLTSPGRLNRSDYQTRLLPIYKATGYITAWHVVSDQKEYEGAHMPWSVWLDNSGYAYHAGTSATPVDGYPASAGCFRLTEACAKGIFRLAQRVGTNNMNFFWGGYNHPTTKKPCTRPTGMANPLAQNMTPQRSTQARKNIFTGIRNWWRRMTGTQPPATQNGRRQSPSESSP